MKLWDHQSAAVRKLRNGSVLVGGTGSGKSLVAVAYYVKREKRKNSLPLYVITTAKKRNDGDWVREAAALGVDNIVVDSWNNIMKYTKVKQALFIFDEQRVVGYGKWTRSFIKISKKNEWILLSATPADKWVDLIPVFMANGFFRNKTHFYSEHVRLAPYIKYPKIVGYNNETKLRRLQKQVYVVMPHKKTTSAHISNVKVGYDKKAVEKVKKLQWNPYTSRPIDSLSEEVAVVRKIINTDLSRVFEIMKIYERVRKLIIFYNINPELDMLRTWFEPLTTVGELNGQIHSAIPTTADWVYLVQYKAGSEAWECFETNHMAFYSMSYSYRETIQAMGRIDRHNTHFTDLYYYRFSSSSYLDHAITMAQSKKKNFNIRSLS